jgi:glutathione S-transferase
VQARLYAIPASNAVLTAQLALERKGVDYRRIDQIPVLHRVAMRLRGFEGSTVPGLTVRDRRVHGSRRIMEALDELWPEPPLYPADFEGRAAVNEALDWGEDVYQRTLRFLLPYSLLRSRAALRAVLDDSLMKFPTELVVRTARPVIFINARLNSSNAGSVRRKLAELPAMFDHVDSLIEQGVLNAAEPGAADLMIAPSTRALLWWEELRPALEGRPAAEHARRVVPRYPGEIPPVFPPGALAGLA